MISAEMTDADQIERADRFIEHVRAAITATVIDPASLCADDQRRGLQRIADTLDAVPFVTICNLANLNAAMRGGLLDLIEVHLMSALAPMPLPVPWHPCSSEKTQEVSMDTTYNVTRSKQLRLGIQELLGSNSRGEIDMSRRNAPAHTALRCLPHSAHPLASE